MESKRSTYESNSATIHSQIININITTNERKRQFTSEESNYMLSSKRPCQMSSNIQMIKDMPENQVTNTDRRSKGKASNVGSVRDFDEESIKFESTLTFMSYTKDKGYTKSTLSRNHSSISVPRWQLFSTCSQGKMRKRGNSDIFAYLKQPMERKARKQG